MLLLLTNNSMSLCRGLMPGSGLSGWDNNRPGWFAAGGSPCHPLPALQHSGAAGVWGLTVPGGLTCSPQAPQTRWCLVCTWHESPQLWVAAPECQTLPIFPPAVCRYVGSRRGSSTGGIAAAGTQELCLCEAAALGAWLQQGFPGEHWGRGHVQAVVHHRHDDGDQKPQWWRGAVPGSHETIPGWQVGLESSLGGSQGRAGGGEGLPGASRQRSEQLTSPWAKLSQQRGGRSGSSQEGAGADVKGSSW